MEVAWWVLGLTHAAASGMAVGAELDHAISVFTTRRSTSSPLFRHLGRGARADLPNFATEIYSLLALAELARNDLLADAEQWAVELADVLIELRLADGGWPWLYRAGRATVVERYEIYSVHQDAMAPMALLALADVTGRDDYAVAAHDGLRWCYGNNELGVTTVDPATQTVASDTA